MWYLIKMELVKGEGFTIMWYLINMELVKGEGFTYRVLVILKKIKSISLF